MRLAALWSTRTLGLIALGALGIAAIAGGAWLIQGSAHPNAIVATSAPNSDGTSVAYVGYEQTRFSPTAGFDAGAVARALDDWRAAHPGAQILGQDAVQKSGLTIGYDIHYR